MHDLAQCPYCHSHEVLLTKAHHQYRVICCQCHASGPADDADSAARSQWNYLSKEVSRSREWHAQSFTSQLAEVEQKLSRA